MPGTRYFFWRRPTVSLALLLSLWGGARSVVAQGEIKTQVKVIPPGGQLPNGTNFHQDPAFSQEPVAANPRKSHTRLYFLNKPWEEVLQKVAKDTHSTLEMAEVPQGKYNNLGFESRDLEDAVKVLNVELKKQGFRLVVREDVICVERMVRERIDYAPAVVGQNAPTTPRQQQPVSRAARPRVPAAHADGAVQPAGFELGAPAERNAPLAIQPQNRPALDIARSLQKTFSERARLENSGPAGFPAFVVDHFDKAAAAVNRPLFTLEIDSQQNQLLVSADKDVQNAIRALVNTVDLNPLTMDEAPALVAGNGHKVEVARELQGPLMNIAQARRARQGDNLLAQAQPGAVQAPVQPPVNQNEPTVQVVPGVNSQSLPTLLANLRGDVTIETIPELDLLIIKGNEADVAAVLKIIEQIEKLAQGSLPQIQLHLLRDVNSQSMTTLLLNVFNQVATQRAQAAQQQDALVQIFPVIVPNAILIIGTDGAIKSVTELAIKLDQPVVAEDEVQIFRLEYAIPSLVLTSLTTLNGQPPALGGFSARFQAVADDRTNTLIVQANPNDLKIVSRVIKGLDVSTSSAASLLKIVPLTSASSDAVATLLNTLIQSTLAQPPGPIVPGQQQIGAVGVATGGINTVAQSVVLQTFAENSETLLRSGLLFNIRFNSDPRTNSLMITAPKESMEFLLHLVAILDRPAGASAQVKIFPLQNADATDVQTLLTTLFAPAQAAAGAAAQQQQPFEIEGTQDPGSTLIPLRVAVDARTNSLTVIGTPQLLDLVQAIIYVVDAGGTTRRETIPYRLKNASADAVATALSTFYDTRLQILTVDQTRISFSSIQDQQIIVQPEPTTNNLIISVTPNYKEEILQLVEQLDANPLQVVIKVLIVEVELNTNDEFGVELGVQDRVLFNRSSAAGIPGFLFNNPILGNNTTAARANPSDVGTQGLTNLAVGRTNANLGYGGLVLTASSEEVSVLIRALASRRRVQVLSRPSIRALDNWQAYIQVGQEVPVVDGITITTGFANPTVVREQSGIILVVTPRISADGSVIMQVGAEKSAFQPGGVPIFVDSTTGSVVTSPIKDLTQAVTTIRVPDGQTVVVGGMITASNATDERGVPWFKDLPYIGAAFRFDSNVERKTELLMFLTPHVLKLDSDSEMVSRVEAGRLHYFQDEAEAIHGPLFGITPEMMMPGPQNGFMQQMPMGQPLSVPPQVQPQLIPPVPPAEDLPPGVAPFAPPVPMTNIRTRRLSPVSHADLQPVGAEEESRQ